MYQLSRFSALILITLCLLSLPLSPQASEPQQVGPVKVSLLTEVEAIQPGLPFQLGLYIEPDEHWHVYWKNPGDAGLPPTLKWDLPDGFSASEIIFPAPEKIISGPLAAYGYHGAVLYHVTITPPENLTVGTHVILKVKADWLVCKEECLPGTANLEISLPVSDKIQKVDAKTAALFEQTKNLIPTLLPETFQTQLTVTPEKLYLDLKPDRLFDDQATFEFFAAEKSIIKHAAEQLLSQTGDSYRLELERSPYSSSDPDHIAGVLTIKSGADTLYYNFTAENSSTATTPVVATTNNQISGIMLALLFAFLGGLILNLMPCVLPVLSLKVLGLVEQAQQGRRASFMHGLFFTIGVMVSFWAIVAVMFILQAGGAQLGWGFQLQSPTFVMILATAMFLFALSLFGLFEINFLVGTAGSLSGKKSSGLSSAFVSGITATLVATPCTAPFMGAALGYSLTQPPFQSFLVYSFVGLGMAAPYLFLSLFPQFLKFVPKPGRWMETLKQGLGFMLMATVIWLGWVLAGQSGSTALVILLGVLLLVALGAWVYGRWGGIASSTKARRFSSAIALVIILASLVYGHEGINRFQIKPSGTTGTEDGIAWEKFSRSDVDQKISEGNPVFIDFTAAWCLSCQVNEQVAFSSEEVQQKFKDLNIAPFKADWTNRDDEIAQALAEFGRNSVPLYVLYTGKNSEPILLPEILTPGIVLEALEKIKPQI